MEPITMIILGAIALILFFTIILAFAWYRVVPQSEAHVVTTPNKTFIASSDPNVSGKDGTRWYFEIPNFVPLLGRVVRLLDITIKEILIGQETIEKGQARYFVNSSTKYRIVDVKKAAETFIDDESLAEQLKEIIKAAVRAVTVKYDVIEARAQKQKMSEEVKKEIVDDFSAWGLELVNFQLVDFQDTPESKIVSDISKRREVEIQSTTREQNAEKFKQARLKEAEAEEKAKEREIAKDKVIGEREQNKAQKIAEQQKIAEEKRFEVIRVQTVKQAEITKAEEIVKAEQKKATELIFKDQKDTG